VTVDASSKIERDIIDGGDHGTHERRPGEEERPAVPVRESSGRRRRRFLAMRNFVVDCRDVEDDAHGQRQRCTHNK